MKFEFIRSARNIKTLLVIFLIGASVSASAFFWKSKIKILCYGEKSVELIYTYELKNGEIYESLILPKKSNKSNKDELISLTKLDDCTIIDSKNWMCGGKTKYQSSGAYRSETHALYEGRYTHMPSSSDIDNYCAKRVQSS
jgi:hypothetical protein